MKSSRYLPVVAGAGVFIVLLVILFPCLASSAFEIDDAGLISIPLIKHPFSFKWLAALLTPGNHVDYYPVRDLSYWFDVHVLGADTTGSDMTVFRLHNMVLWALSAGVLWQILSMLGAWPWWAVLWAVHPVHFETLIWASARKDVLCILFALTACLAFLLWSRERRSGYLILSYSAFVLSLLSKAAFGLLPIVAIVCVYFARSEDRRHIYSRLLPAVLLGVGSSAFQSWFYAYGNDMRFFYPWSYRVGAAAVAFAKVAAGWFYPPLNVVDVENWGNWLDLNRSWVPFGAFLWILLVSGSAVAVARRSVAWGSGVLSFWLLYLPVSGLAFPHRTFYSIRYFEAPVLAILIAVAVWIGRRQAVWVGAPILGVLLIGAGLVEAHHWEGSLEITSKALSSIPESPSLKFVHFSALSNLRRWGRLTSDQVSETDALEAEIRDLCNPSSRPLSTSGDLCSAFWTRSDWPIKVKSDEKVSLALSRIEPILSQSSRRKMETQLRFRLAENKGRLSGVEAQDWLKANQSLNRPELRVERWLALCALGEVQRARELLRIDLDAGLLDRFTIAERLPRARMAALRTCGL